MIPRILEDGELFFWINAQDAAHESRASVYVGKGADSNAAAAKFWLDPAVELAHTGQSLTFEELRHAQQTIAAHRDELRMAWQGYRGG